LVTTVHVEERLREDAESELARARRLGQQWAMERATGGQLRRLARHVESATFARRPLCEWNAHAVGAVVLGSSASAEGITSFWRDVLGKDRPSDDEVACFAYDAIAVWGGSTLADPALAAINTDLPDMKIMLSQHIHRAKLLAVEFARHTRFLRN